MTRARRQEAALDRILELVLFLNDDMTQSLDRRGLTASRTHLLSELRRSGPATQRVLATAMRVSARNVTGLVDGLVATGFVTREAHPTDRRATLVTFTDHGAATTQALFDERQGLARQVFSAMPSDQFDCFTAGLDHVLGALQSAAVQAASVQAGPTAGGTR